MTTTTASQTVQSQNTHDGPPRVFVSYTHESPDHKRWVASLASRLRADGVDAVLDQWDLKLGQDITLFMESGIRNSDRVLLVCTPAYAAKANEGVGGVGYERMVVTAELAKRIDTKKFVCLLRDGSEDDSIPTFAQSRKWTDFRDDALFESSLEDLLRDIHEVPAKPKPPLGSNPFRSDGRSVTSLTGSDLVSIDEVEGLDVETVYSTAVELLRRHDYLGWNRFLRKLITNINPSLVEWRGSLPGKISKEDWPTNFEDALHISAPLMVAALTAIDSDAEEVKNQRSLLHSFIELDGWEVRGPEPVVLIPYALGYIYHHLVGSFLLSSNKHLDAIQLLLATIRLKNQNSRTGQVWSTKGLMGWVDSLGQNCFDSWNYLLKFYDSHSWCEHFFVSESDYHKCLRGYQMIASIIELCEFLRRHPDKVSQLEPQCNLDVPPMFLIDDSSRDILFSTLSKAFPNSSVVKSILDEFSIPRDLFDKSWSIWVTVWIKWCSSTRRGVYVGLHIDPEKVPLPA